MNIAQGLLPFQLVEDTSQVLITSFGGLPLVMETFRALGLAQSVQKHLPLQKLVFQPFHTKEQKAT